MKLLESTKSKITKDENGENVLIHCNIANNDYQQNSGDLYTFVLNKPFFQLLNISCKNFVFLKIFNLEFLHIDVGFTDQNSKPLGVEDKINITLVIK